ncbi:MAG: ThiF family adenylyltransferase, partial [Desulfobacteraceae bacterium]|nr:ThiF family adenylyltransferase [Desulfobacteraceae bacterium]
MSYKVSPMGLPPDYRTLVVGCGGTGSFVAEGLCRILGSDHPLLLIDHDRVEPHNLRRQNYFEQDVGKFKSQALAERLALRYGRRIAYSVYP